jgi:hypothetical protein
MFGYVYPVLHGKEVSRALALSLSQHPDEHRPQRPILLVIDQMLGDPAVRVSGPPNARDLRGRELRPAF